MRPLIGRSKRGNGAPLSAAEVERLTAWPGVAADPPDLAGEADLETVRRALQSLPDRRGAIFRRVWVEGASLAGAAAQFGMDERTFRQELMLAVRALHEATQNNAVAALQERLAKVSPQ